MHDVRVGKAHVEPRGIEARFAADCPLELQEFGIQILQRAQVESLDVDIEPVKFGESRIQDVELSGGAATSDCSRHVRVGKGEP